MSVIIRDMRMPETCDECPCHHYHSAGKYVCEATPMFYPWNLANTKGIRKEWCPLIELPPHGRLIDADALMARCKDEKGKYKSYEAAVIGESIELFPTIIEAEGE